MRRHVSAAVAAALSCALAFPALPNAAELPTDCQAKAAYLQFLIASRRQGINESELVDYDPHIDSAWKKEARRRVYTDAELISSDLGQTIYKFYSSCIANSEAEKPRSGTKFAVPKQ